MNKYVIRFKDTILGGEYCILIEAENTIQAIKVIMTEQPNRFNDGNFEIIKINEVSNTRKLKIEEMIKSIKFNADLAKSWLEEKNDSDYARGICKSYLEVLSLIEKVEE